MRYLLKLILHNNLCKIGLKVFRIKKLMKINKKNMIKEKNS